MTPGTQGRAVHGGTPGTRPTMKDVAERAGVAVKTVSRVVNGEPGVKAGTAGRVQVAIEDLGFRPNELARLFRAGVPVADIGALHALIRDILQALPDTADEPEWRDRAGALNICDPDGKRYRAYTEEDL